MVRIAVAQINVTVGDLSGNRHKVAQGIAQAKAQDADLVVFPELAVCGYPPEDLLHKDHFVRDNLKVLHSLAKTVKGIMAVVGFVDRDNCKRIYNAAAVLSNGRIAGVYRKKELPNYGVFDEKRYFSHGKSLGRIFSLGKDRFGISICEDIWVDNGICHKMARSNCRLLINISSSPYDVGKLRKREDLLRRRAKQAGAFLCYANLVGGQDELVFDGGSLVVDPQGRIVASAGQFEEDLMVVDLNLEKSKVRMAAKRPAKKPVKPHITKRLGRTERIYRALVLGTRDYARKNGFQKIVLGLSGGVDSSLVAVIAADAVGRENVIGVTMPSRYNSKGTQADARRLAENLDILVIGLPINKIFGVYLSQMRSYFKKTVPGLAEENLQARIRGNILMALSNKFGWLVLTTGNKSEVAVGYCTLYGDMSGGFAVIKDVPKTTVYALAEFCNLRHKGPLIPKSVLARAPSAELRKNQKDRDNLPPYDVLDAMLKEYVEKHSSLAQMTRAGNKKLVQRVIALVDRNEYKRRQAPPGIKITQRAFGKDWRLPITNKYREE